MNWKLIRHIDAYLGIPLIYALLGAQKLFGRRGHASLRRSGKRILLVKFWGIGNIFLMLPSVNSLWAAYPDAEIDLLTLEASRDAARCTQAFNAIHAVDTKGMNRFLQTTLTMLAVLRRRDYDLIIDFEQFARFSALCIALIGRKTTIGFNTTSQHRHILLTQPVPYDNTLHITRSYSTLVQAAGAEAARSVDPAVLSDRSAPNILTRLGILPERTVIILHTGTSDNFSERRWPAQHYAALADLLMQDRDVQIVLSGLQEEAGLAAEVSRNIRERDRVIDLSGALSFDGFYQAIGSSDLVVTADTSAVHIASALATPVVALYGPNTPVLYGPWGKDGIAFYKKLACSPCITNFNAKTHICRHPEGKGACMKRITPAEVYLQIQARACQRAGGLKRRRPIGGGT